MDIRYCEYASTRVVRTYAEHAAHDRNGLENPATNSAVWEQNAALRNRLQNNPNLRANGFFGVCFFYLVSVRFIRWVGFLCGCCPLDSGREIHNTQIQQ